MRSVRLTVVLAMLAGVLCHGADVRFGAGISAKTDPAAAAAEACSQAKAAIAPAAVKCLLLCDNFDGQRAEVLKGACTIVPASVVHGVVTHAQFTNAAAPGGKSVAALAIGGEDAQVSAACVPNVRGRELECGAELGGKLKDAVEGAQAGKLLILVGDCHVPKNKPLTQGVQQALGKDLAIIGCSAKTTKDVCVYSGGKQVAQGALAVLISGPFQIGLSAGTVGWNKGTPDQICQSAGQTVDAAVKALGTTPDAIVAFDCGGRRGLLLKGRPSMADGELKAIRKVLAPDVPLLAMYGSGEIGHVDGKTPSEGVGYHIAVCAIAADR